jgi:hypothetical protein
MGYGIAVGIEYTHRRDLSLGKLFLPPRFADKILRFKATLFGISFVAEQRY